MENRALPVDFRKTMAREAVQDWAAYVRWGGRLPELGIRPSPFERRSEKNTAVTAWQGRSHWMTEELAEAVGREFSGLPIKKQHIIRDHYINRAQIIEQLLDQQWTEHFEGNGEIVDYLNANFEHVPQGVKQILDKAGQVNASAGGCLELYESNAKVRGDKSRLSDVWGHVSTVTETVTCVQDALYEQLTIAVDDHRMAAEAANDPSMIEALHGKVRVANKAHASVSRELERIKSISAEVARNARGQVAKSKGEKVEDLALKMARRRGYSGTSYWYRTIQEFTGQVQDMLERLRVPEYERLEQGLHGKNEGYQINA